MSILDTIVKEKKKEVIFLKKKTPKKQLVNLCKKKRKVLQFTRNISKPGKLNIIGEIKRSSPSAGLIRKDFSPLRIARIYKKNQFAAISVLTDEKFFKGKLRFIKLIKNKVKLPILRKDFIIDDYQIYESYLAGADAILLIAQLLNNKELKNFILLAKKLGLSALVEVHNLGDVNKALKAGAQIIGINNRNLKTFKVDLKVTERLKKLIPKGKIVVSESGIKSHKDFENLKALGINAVLIGETFMRASNIDNKIKSLIKKK